MRVTIALATGLALVALALPAASAKQKSKPPIPFDTVIMADQVRIDQGGELWREQCTHCHGAKAYPGKAPKLKPRRYKPDFVYRRITDGFRKMPAWDDYYSDDERMNLVTYIMSEQFSP